MVGRLSNIAYALDEDREDCNVWEKIYQASGVVQSQPVAAWNIIADLMCAVRHRDLAILDAGCGTGRHTIAALRTFPNAAVTSFDSSQRSLELLGSLVTQNIRSGRLTTQQLDIDSPLPYQQRSFDLVISTLVIHHGFWRDVESRFRLLTSLIKPGGFMLFAGLSDQDPRVRTGYEVEPGTRLDTAQEDGALPHHFLSSADIDWLFEGYITCHREVAHRPMVTAKGDAAHWEVVARRPGKDSERIDL